MNYEINIDLNEGRITYGLYSFLYEDKNRILNDLEDLELAIKALKSYNELGFTFQVFCKLYPDLGDINDHAMDKQLIRNRLRI